MKIVADLKRTLVAGMIIHAKHHGCLASMPTAKDMGNRKVEKTNSVGIQFLMEDGNISYLDWPKSKEFKAHEDGKGFDVLMSKITQVPDDRPLLTYRFVENQ